MAQGAQLPVHHRQQARFAGREHQVVDAEVAVHQGHAAVVGGAALSKRRHQRVHVGDRLDFTGAVLVGPPVDLAGEIIAGFAVVAQADRRRVQRMQGGQRGDDRFVVRRALVRRHVRQRGIPVHLAGHEGHQVEDRTDHRFIGAQVQRLGHRHRAAVQRLQHAELAIHGMRRGQQLPRRLAPQHVFAAGGFDQIGRVRLPALELRRHHRPPKPRHLRFQIRRKLVSGELHLLSLEEIFCHG